ncbi:PilN domain-containing protein [Candidatus Magnetominusculus dajiuhuensis]|uniref:PilN domain-containing protein n=1 Tax=Candidatus Magnetominusculus dajiuhuensis TaxID=3137712 RepID=UPI003B437A29
MIKINLLPSDGKAKRRKKPPAAIPILYAVIVLVLVLSLAGAGFGYKILSNKLNMMQKEKAEKTKQLEALKNKTKDVEALEKKIKEIADNKKVIEQLIANQTTPVKVLDEISKLLPDNVWLTKMSINEQGLSLSGTAEKNDDLVIFVNKLKNSKLFNNVYLSKSQSGSISMGGTGHADMPVYNFEMQMSINVVVKAA